MLCAIFLMQTGPDLAPELFSEPDGGPGPWSSFGYCRDMRGFGLVEPMSDCDIGEARWHRAYERAPVDVRECDNQITRRGPDCTTRF